MVIVLQHEGAPIDEVHESVWSTLRGVEGPPTGYFDPFCRLREGRGHRFHSDTGLLSLEEVRRLPFAGTITPVPRTVTGNMNAPSPPAQI